MYKNIALVILLLVAFLLIKDKSETIGNPLVITHIDTVYKNDTTKIYKEGNKIPFVVLDTIYKNDTIHDTAFIVKDWYQVKNYIDSFMVDSSIFIINDTISQNKIKGRSFEAQIKQKTIIVTNTIQPKSKDCIYLGFLGDLRRFDNKIGLGVGALYLKGEKRAYFGNVTTNQISLGLYIKF